MKQSHLLRLAFRALEKRFVALLFRYYEGCFYRELTSGVIHIVTIGLDARNNQTFQVLCGLNSRLISGEGEISHLGVIRAAHVTPMGWDRNSGHWPCDDESTALESLSKIGLLIDSLIMPWFQERTTLSAMADELSAEHDGLRKAKLYIADDNLGQARESLSTFRERLNKPMRWLDPVRLEAIKEEVETLLRGT